MQVWRKGGGERGRYRRHLWGVTRTVCRVLCMWLDKSHLTTHECLAVGRCSYNVESFSNHFYCSGEFVPSLRTAPGRHTTSVRSHWSTHLPALLTIALCKSIPLTTQTQLQTLSQQQEIHFVTRAVYGELTAEARFKPGLIHC